jgi:hypothetical protein
VSAAPKRNLPASVRQQLLTLSQQRKQPFDLVLVRYGIERLLYRLSRSPHADRLVLKGAMLFAVWSEAMHRPTRDVDFLGFGSADRDGLKAVFVELCQLEVEPDGLSYLSESVRAESIRDEEAYPGTRITLEARLENVRIPVQADIGFGDAITPAPEAIEFPTLLDFPAPHLRAYPIYTVVAEKLEAVVRLSEANSRMKDFFDLWYLSRNFSFDGGDLAAALTRTFIRRQMALPADVPTGLTAEFAALKVAPWAAFVRRNALGSVELSAVLQAVRAFALPPLRAAATQAAFVQRWTPADGWRQV